MNTRSRQILSRSLYVIGILFFTPVHLCAAGAHPSVHPSANPQDIVRHSATSRDQGALKDLLDDDIAGNCARAYHQLHARGTKATPTLRDGLQSEDWQQRFLSAVLMARTQPQAKDLERTCRILIGHLADNQIRGDALLAGHALVAIGPEAFGYLYYAAWHNEEQLGNRCRELMILVAPHGWRPKRQARAEKALQSLNLTLAWTGIGKPTLPSLSNALPSAEERLRQILIDLHSDNRRGNAVLAHAAFSGYRYRNPPKQEALIRPLLYEGLHDPDRQCRLLCAVMLMQRDVPPTASLLAAAIESLLDDEFGYWNTKAVLVSNANEAQRYLLRHPAEARIFLYGALDSTSLAQRIRAAAVLAQSRDGQTETYVPMLIDHLRDNNTPLDASLAGISLALLGPAVLPYLDETPVDFQQEHYFDVIRRAVRIREIDSSARIPIVNDGMNFGRRHL